MGDTARLQLHPESHIRPPAMLYENTLYSNRFMTPQEGAVLPPRPSIHLFTRISAPLIHERSGFSSFHFQVSLDQVQYARASYFSATSLYSECMGVFEQ